MGKASALTAALNSSQSPDKASSTATSNSSSVSSAFPCLYQRNSGADDAFEVDLDLEKLRLSNTPKLNRAPTSVRRRSLDASQVQKDACKGFCCSRPDSHCRIRHALNKEMVQICCIIACYLHMSTGLKR